MYRKAVRGWLKHVDFIILDMLCLLAASALAMGFNTFSGHLQDRSFCYLMLRALLIDLFVTVALNTMNNVLFRSYDKEFTALLRQIFYFAVFIAFIIYAEEAETPFTLQMNIVSGVLYLLISYAMRLMWKCVLIWSPWGKGGRQHVLVVTDTNSATEVVERINHFPFWRCQLAGLVMVDRDMKGQSINGVPVVANLSDAADYLCHAWMDEVFFFRVSPQLQCADLLAKCKEMALTVHLYLYLRDGNEGKQTFERVAGYEVLTANINMLSTKEAFLKRSFDILVGLLGSLATLVVLAIIAPPLKMASPGPLLFKQTRIGENGRKFKMYKIRSMYMNAEELKAKYAAQNVHTDGMMFKMDFDPRVIGNYILPDGTQKKGIGDFIRRTNLDEFPQFFNVLKGDMSIVGTRPPTLDEWEKYTFHHRARMSVKPGLTGLWQISKEKDHLPFDEIVRLDTEYISTWSIGSDLRIIVQTGIYVIKQLLGIKKAVPENNIYKA